MRKYFFITFSLSLSLMMFSSVLAQSPHAYFDLLSAKPEMLISKAYRTQAEIDADMVASHGGTVYSATEDAAEFTERVGVGDDDGGIPIADQLRPPFEPNLTMSSGNLLYCYELKYPSEFVADGAVNGVKTYKSTQIRKDRGNRAQTIEPRYRFHQVNSPYVARVDIRIYGNGNGGYTTDRGALAPQVDEFYVLPNVWTRHWLFLDFDNDTLSYWVGDETRSNVLVIDHAPMDWDREFPGALLKDFWFEFNTSSHKDDGVPELNFWARNLVMLKDVSNASSLVSQGDSGGGGGVDVSPPASPQNLNVQ